MIKNYSGESLIGIIIGIFMLAFIMLAISNLLINNKITIKKYKDINYQQILSNNTNFILTKLDTSGVNVGSGFFIKKDNLTNTFKVLTGTINESYKYIDSTGNNIENINSFDGNIYERSIILKRRDNIYGKTNDIFEVNIKKINK